MAKKATRRSRPSVNGFNRARPRVRDNEGKTITLKWNEPRPDLAVRAIASLRVTRAGLGLAGVRLEAEEILQSGCGERQVINRLRRLGSEVAGVLVKIAASGAACSCGAACAQAAIGALGYFPTAAAADCLRRIADDARADLGARAKALTALGQIGAPSGVDYLRRVLTHGRDPELRRAAARGLGHSGSVDAIEALTTAVEKDSNLLVQQMAYGALQAVAGTNRLPLPRLAPPPRSHLARPERHQPPKGVYR